MVSGRRSHAGCNTAAERAIWGAHRGGYDHGDERPSARAGSPLAHKSVRAEERDCALTGPGAQVLGAWLG